MKCFNINSTKLKFKSNFKKDEITGCWNWIGPKTSDGYGGMSSSFTGKSKMYRAHRLSYILFKESIIPDDKQILHKCNNTLCVNPDHLYAGSHLDNMKDLRESGVLSGKNNPNFGVKCSEEKKEKLRGSNSKAWKDPKIREKYLKSFGKRKDKNE